jgi:tetratricopeptide (TPR) repeat protein
LDGNDGSASGVASTNRIRTRQILREAEGYLELSMPQHALGVLDRLGEASSSQSQALFLRGDALRLLKRDGEAIESLTQATELAPANVAIWLALAACYKRLARLESAIESLEHALELDPREAQIPYQLACSWCLAGGKHQALDYLSKALALDSGIRELLPKEPDFESIRSDPEFQALTSIIV